MSIGGLLSGFRVPYKVRLKQDLLVVWVINFVIYVCKNYVTFKTKTTKSKRLLENFDQYLLLVVDLNLNIRLLKLKSKLIFTISLSDSLRTF